MYSIRIIRMRVGPGGWESQSNGPLNLCLGKTVSGRTTVTMSTQIKTLPRTDSEWKEKEAGLTQTVF